MGYDRGDSFPFDFEPNGIPFGSENRKENCHHDHIPFNKEGNGNIVFSVHRFSACPTFCCPINPGWKNNSDFFPGIRGGPIDAPLVS